MAFGQLLDGLVIASLHQQVILAWKLPGGIQGLFGLLAGIGIVAERAPDRGQGGMRKRIRGVGRGGAREQIPCGQRIEGSRSWLRPCEYSRRASDIGRNRCREPWDSSSEIFDSPNRSRKARTDPGSEIQQIGLGTEFRRCDHCLSRGCVLQRASRRIRPPDSVGWRR
jgi:hypothetical protein